MKKKIKLIVSDIEGCLTINKRQPIDTGMLTRIHAYCELARNGKKPPIVLCTGRPQPYAEAIIQTLDAFFPNFPSIVENGCFLYDPVDDVIVPHPAIEGRNDLKKIRSFLNKEMIAKKLCKVEPGKELCISLNPILGMGIEELHQAVIKTLPVKMRDMVFVTHSSSAVDITPKGVNKASGLEFLSKRIGVSCEEMIGIGDTAGDFPMLKKVGHPACPSNAKKEVIGLVRARGGYVAGSPNTAGVWEILLHYNLME